MSEQVKLTIPASSDYISVARLTISGLAAKLNFTVDEIEDLKIAVSEACTNVIQHAYEGDSGDIEITASVENEALEIIVTDTGRGFDVNNISSKKLEDEDFKEFGLGLGLTFIKTLMDETSFTSELGKGSSIKMVKSAPH